jgi:hypothetical protein
MIIENRKIHIHAITEEWNGAICSCFYENGNTRIVWDASSPIPQKTEVEIITAHDNYIGKSSFLDEIDRLESTVTPRRIREMTTVAGAKWVDDVEKLIVIERAKL